jgi:SAM-dependent methyltransferase
MNCGKKSESSSEKHNQEYYSVLEYRYSAALTNCIEADSFGVVTLLDVIDQMIDREKLVDSVHRVLKHGGTFIIGTDVVDDVRGRKPWSWLLPAARHFSADSRAARFIFCVEAQRSHRRKYENSHVSAFDLERLQTSKGFTVPHCIYPMVGAPIRDFVLKFFPRAWR